MSTRDLHALIEAPNGDAVKALREAGSWLETDDETGKPLWRVWCEITPTVDVAAFTAKEARRLAREKAEEEFAHVDDVTISSVCRATSK